MGKIIYYTKSVCPHCMKMIPATVEEKDGQIYMKKQCLEHGVFQTLIWQDNEKEYTKWLSYGGVNVEKLPQTPEDAMKLGNDLDFHCEACMQPSSAALMTTTKCNVNCPVCFTKTKNEKLYEPTFTQLKELIDFYRMKAGEDAILELCGGEPTTREDLCEIASYARSQGFDYIQLNSNGIRLAQSVDYCKELRNSGITTVYLGFDALTEKPYLAKYGRKMLEVKKQAVENCESAGLAIVLVTCVIPGENDGELGDIIEFAKQHIPSVKGVYFQPVSYFGTYENEKVKRITIPQVLRQLEEQTKGEVKKEDFSPGCYEHPQCSFNGNYVLGPTGKLMRVTKCTKKEHDPKGYHAIRKIVRKTWLPQKLKTLTIGGMAFQDAWNIDLLRISRCSVQIIGKDQRMIPLCSKYLTDTKQNKINPGIS